MSWISCSYKYIFPSIIYFFLTFRNRQKYSKKIKKQNNNDNSNNDEKNRQTKDP